MPRMKKIPELYYYTTVETMKFILDGGNIFATYLKFMNDSEEYTNGLYELRKVINEEYGRGNVLITEQQLKENIEADSEIYSISFSAERDLLSQWSMYARESGVSLKMKFSGHEKYYAFRGTKGNRELITNLQLYPREVYYFTERAMKSEKYISVKKKIIKDIERGNSKNTILDMESNAEQIWQDMTPYVKRYEFQAEGEYRLAFSIRKFSPGLRIDYRNDKHVLKPYLDVECEHGWPVQEIIVGPGFNQDAVYRSMRHFMGHARLKVPQLSGTDFQERCSAFIKKENMPAEVADLWNHRSVRFKVDDKILRHQAFRDFQKEIMNIPNVSEEYKKYIGERYLSRDGIVISKSEIPYIY